MVEAVIAFGGIDLVVNNAGITRAGSLGDTSYEDWDLQYAIMPRGSFVVAKAVEPVLRAQGLGGDIVNICSKNAVFAGPNNIAYSSAKAAQAHMVRLLAAELGDIGVRVNGVNPDGVVRGSGIFSGGWGASRAKTYGVAEEDLGKYYAQRTVLKEEVLPSTAPWPSSRSPGAAAGHHRAHRAGRLRCPAGLPPLTTRSQETSS